MRLRAADQESGMTVYHRDDHEGSHPKKSKLSLVGNRTVHKQNVRQRRYRGMDLRDSGTKGHPAAALWHRRHASADVTGQLASRETQRQRRLLGASQASATADGSLDSPDYRRRRPGRPTSQTC